MILTSSLRRRSSLVLFALAALTTAGCGDDGPGESSAVDGPTVVATTTQLTDIAGEVAGERAEVLGILTANADPHDHEPKPSDAEALTEAGLVLQSGGDLDAWLGELVESSGTDAETLELLGVVETIEGGHESSSGEEHAGEEDEEHADEGEEGVDPHWWQNPLNAVAAADAIAARLAEIDPEGASEYEANAADFSRRVERLDAAIAECLAEIPDAERKLVTSHDSLGYFAERYEIEVAGAAIPALTTQAQASAGEVAELVELIRDEGVNAVFGEAGVSTDLEQAIAGDAGAEVGAELYADTLGPEGSEAESYLGSIATNARAIAEGLSGGAVRCGLPGG